MFTSVTFPLAWRGLAAGAVLAFARALGDFGTTLMVAGDIPGLTADGLAGDLRRRTGRQRRRVRPSLASDPLHLVDLDCLARARAMDFAHTGA